MSIAPISAAAIWAIASNYVLVKWTVRLMSLISATIPSTPWHPVSGRLGALMSQHFQSHRVAQK
jgi:hypothetical protein